VKALAIDFSLTYVEVLHSARDGKWLKDESREDADELPEPQDLAAEAITELEAAVDDLREIAAMLEASVS